MQLLMTMTLTCIMAAAMNAQTTMTGLPEHKVDLAGSPDSPFVVNGSTKTIVGYVLRMTEEKGVVSYDATRFHPQRLPVGLPIGPGASDVGRTTENRAIRVNKDGTPVVFRAASIEVVLFSDGTMGGPNQNDFLASFAKGMGMDKETLIRSLLDIEGRKK
jgi:hypothetical protein